MSRPHSPRIRDLGVVREHVEREEAARLVAEAEELGFTLAQPMQDWWTAQRGGRLVADRLPALLERLQVIGPAKAEKQAA